LQWFCSILEMRKHLQDWGNRENCRNRWNSTESTQNPMAPWSNLKR
jgi:hypothetical protein